MVNWRHFGIISLIVDLKCIGLGDTASTMLKYKANGGHIAVTMHDKLYIGIAETLEEVSTVSGFCWKRILKFIV